MKRKNKCVECRHCDMKLDPNKGTKHLCASKKKVLPSNVTSRPACERFEPPKPSSHWGP